MEGPCASSTARGFAAVLPIWSRTQNKLKIVYAASRLEDLAVPPGNRLEALKCDRRGQWSIRVNDRWRICFTWDGTRATAIEVVDYH